MSDIALWYGIMRHPIKRQDKMIRKLLLIGILSIVQGSSVSRSIAAELVSPLQGVPSLDDMAGDWIPMANVANPPAVHNFNQMLVVDHDLTSFFCNPGGLYPWQHGYPIIKLSIDGHE